MFAQTCCCYALSIACLFLIICFVCVQAGFAFEPSLFSAPPWRLLLKLFGVPTFQKVVVCRLAVKSWVANLPQSCGLPTRCKVESHIPICGSAIKGNTATFNKYVPLMLLGVENERCCSASICSLLVCLTRSATFPLFQEMLYVHVCMYRNDLQIIVKCCSEFCVIITCTGCEALSSQ